MSKAVAWCAVVLVTLSMVVLLTWFVFTLAAILDSGAMVVWLLQ